MNAMQNDKPVAHMFWDGKITTYQKASILSAYNAGFHVILWSFTRHDLPNEIEQRSAEDILRRQEVAHLEYDGWHRGQSIEHRQRALYSDFFRAEVIDQLGGWWFDTDILFLKTAQEFEALREKKIVAGQEPHTFFSVNNAVLSFGDPKYAKLYKLFLYELAKDRVAFKWGEFGPGALNKMFSRLNLSQDVNPQNFFYPIPVHDRKEMYASAGFSRNRCYDKVKDSYCIHWWNSSEFNKKSGFLDKPHNSSFLGVEFKKVFEQFEIKRRQS